MLRVCGWVCVWGGGGSGGSTVGGGTLYRPVSMAQVEPTVAPTSTDSTCAGPPQMNSCESDSESNMNTRGKRSTNS